jgi:uncharacterized damage-inducible protein DinB
MNKQSQSSTADKMYIDLLLKSWTTYVSRISEFIETLPDEALSKEIAPGKNTGTYVLGHLVAVHDAMFPLLEKGTAIYPHLYNSFVKSPDKSGHEFPSIQELKSYWKSVNQKLMDQFQTLTPEEWLSRHTAVSEEDFKKEPHRNKLNILISRTTHLSYHWGQLILLK